MATIYSITSDKGDKVYIGSTISSLKQRKYSHKSNAHTCTSKIIFEEYGFENCIFTALEECPLEQRYERERWYIENTPNMVNTTIPTRTRKERRAIGLYTEQQKKYRDANKEKVKEQKRQYYIANKEKIDNRNKLYREANPEAYRRYVRVYRAKKLIQE